MVVAYAIMAAVALLLLIGYLVLVKEKTPWLMLLYICVTVINLGYFFLSVSPNLTWALLSNDFVYLGSVFLPLCMFMTILKLCGFQYQKWLPITLTCLGFFMLAVVCTTGLLPWYYKEVSVVFVDGAAKLRKVYGILHPVYMLYLLGYFAAMIGVIITSRKKRLIASRKHALLLAMVVLGNIAVWLVEKIVPWDFEFLAMSYLFSELMLLGLYWLMQDYAVQLAEAPAPQEDPEKQLTPKEREVLRLLRAGVKRKDIAVQLCLSENTVKTHIRNLYSKMGVSSREEL